MSKRTEIELLLLQKGFIEKLKSARLSHYEYFSPGENVTIKISSKYPLRSVSILVLCEKCDLKFQVFEYRKKNVCPRCGNRDCSIVHKTPEEQISIVDKAKNMPLD